MRHETLCERLVWARKRAGVTTNRLSVISGLSRTHLYMIESGERSALSYVTIGKLSRALGVTAEWLTEGTGPVPADGDIVAAVQAADRARGAKGPVAPKSKRKRAHRPAA